MQILSVGKAFPAHYYDQEALLVGFKGLWEGRFFNPDRLDQLHRHVMVGGRFLALPMEDYANLHTFDEANDAYIRCAVDLGAQALAHSLELAGLPLDRLDHLFFVSVTGLATPSIDARIVNRLGLRRDLKRTPIFGLGCVAGAAGIARAADYLKAYPRQVAALLSVELCSLTLQRDDLALANIVASGLFGDGAAAVTLGGADLAHASTQRGPRVVATRAVFYPDSEDVMGWHIGARGFQVVLSPQVPLLVREHLRADVESFLASRELELGDIRRFVCHPGGPKVLEAVQESLDLPAEALATTWNSLRELGNLSSASVLMVLADTMVNDPPDPGSYGLMLAMGPGFCSELVLLKW